MGNFKNNPGNANLTIGGGKDGEEPKEAKNPKSAIQENGVPRVVRENGVPRWHSRGYLPHFESSEVTQHVTFHLADSLPQTVLLRLEAELETLPSEKRDVEKRKRVEAWIDAGHGSCVLRTPGIAEMVQGSLLSFDSQRYRLLAWVIMPNHVHVLFQPMNGWTVAKIVASWKKFTARKICDLWRESGEGPIAPGLSGRQSGDSSRQTLGMEQSWRFRGVWHREYWDRYIRNERHFAQAVEYIHLNPVRAGLVVTAEGWRWSSAYENANREIGVPRAKV